MPGTRFIPLATAFAALAVTLGACGGDDETTTSSTSTTTTSSTTSTTTGATGDDELADCKPEDAFVDPASGEFAGLDLDCRPGTEPPAIEITDLEAAADAAEL